MLLRAKPENRMADCRAASYGHSDGLSDGFRTRFCNLVNLAFPSSLPRSRECRSGGLIGLYSLRRGRHLKIKVDLLASFCRKSHLRTTMTGLCVTFYPCGKASQTSLKGWWQVFIRNAGRLPIGADWEKQRFFFQTANKRLGATKNRL